MAVLPLASPPCSAEVSSPRRSERGAFAPRLLICSGPRGQPWTGYHRTTLSCTGFTPSGRAITSSALSRHTRHHHLLYQINRRHSCTKYSPNQFVASPQLDDKIDRAVGSANKSAGCIVRRSPESGKLFLCCRREASLQHRISDNTHGATQQFRSGAPYGAIG